MSKSYFTLLIHYTVLSYINCLRKPMEWVGMEKPQNLEHSVELSGSVWEYERQLTVDLLCVHSVPETTILTEFCFSTMIPSCTWDTE